jgi:hypothetical protein
MMSLPHRALVLALGGGLPWLGGCNDRNADERAVVQNERALGAAFVTGDGAAIDRLLAGDFVGVAPSGSFYDKAKALRLARQGRHLTSDQVGAVTVRFFGRTAVAQGREHEIGPAPDRRAADRVWTDVWVWRDGRWRIEAAEDLDPARR